MVKNEKNEQKDEKKRKKLTKTEIERIDKKWKEKISVDIKGYELKVDKYFRDSKIAALMEDLQMGMLECRKHGGDEVQFGTVYFGFLIIRHFTDLKTPDEIEEQFEFMQVLADNELLDPIMEALPQDQISKVLEKIPQFTENVNEFVSQLSEDVLNSELDNEDVLKMNEWAESVKEDAKGKNTH